MTAIPTENPLTKYKTELEVWPSLETPNDILQLHSNLASKTTAGLPKDISREIELKLNGYCNHIFELFENKQTNSSSILPTISIEFGDTQAKMGIYINNGSSFTSSRFSSTYPRSGMIASRDILLGYLMKIPKQNDNNPSKEMEAVMSLLKWFKKQYEKVKNYERALIAIPASLGVESRMVLRKAAHSAQFTKCHFFTESSLAALTILTKASNPYPNVVVISAGITGLEVAMYTIVFKAVKMVALSIFEWDLKDSDIEVKGCGPFCRGNKLKKAMEFEENKMRILVQTYEKAMTQLGEPMTQLKRECVFLTESPKWNEAFKQFQDTMSGDFKVTEMDKDFGLLALMRLSNNTTEKIFRALQDHVIPVTEVDGVQRNSDDPIMV